jgi:5,6-dimethylbenzimidazole synthase
MSKLRRRAHRRRARRAIVGNEALPMDQPNFFGDYDTLIELVRNRVSVRKLKPDPIPDDYVNKILEIGRWAMSGANGQPWEFVVVKDPKIKKELFRVYIEENSDFIYWMEQ